MLRETRFSQPSRGKLQRFLKLRGRRQRGLQRAGGELVDQGARKGAAGRGDAGGRQPGLGQRVGAATRGLGQRPGWRPPG